MIFLYFSAIRKEKEGAKLACYAFRLNKCVIQLNVT